MGGLFAYRRLMGYPSTLGVSLLRVVEKDNCGAEKRRGRTPAQRREARITRRCRYICVGWGEGEKRESIWVGNRTRVVMDAPAGDLDG